MPNDIDFSISGANQSFLFKVNLSLKNRVDFMKDVKARNGGSSLWTWGNGSEGGPPMT